MFSPLRDDVRVLSICSLIRKAKQSLLPKINLWREGQTLDVWLSVVHRPQGTATNPEEGEEKTISKIMKCAVTANKELRFNSSDEEIK